MKAGIYSLSDAEYHSAPTDKPALSASIAKILCVDTPLHAWTQSRLNPNYKREDKEAFELGTVAHALMLQGLQAATILPFDDWRTRDARAARQTARDLGQTPILEKHWERVKAMVEAGKKQIAEHRDASDAFDPTDGKPEVTLIWEDDYGVMCKSRLDWLTNSRLRIYDYKTLDGTANGEALGKYATANGWDVQSAFYLRGLKKLTGIDADFLFVAQETYEPFALSVLGLTEETLTTGAKKVQYAIETWSKCLSQNEWPAYSDRIYSVPFDMWDAERWAAKESK